MVDKSIVDKMFQVCYGAYNNAYAPYSNFKVGAAILADNDKIYCGCNVENVSYPCSQCAEASAISDMVVHSKQEKIKAVMIMANYSKIEDICTPCGACRQKLSEFADDSTLVYLANTERVQKVISLVELLPLSFNKKSLQT